MDKRSRCADAADLSACRAKRECDDTIIGSTQWLDADGRRHERYQVITLRDGKIADMQGFASRRRAERFARRRSSIPR